MPKRIDRPVPEVLALLLADVVHQDPESAKFSILGVHHVIGAWSFPVTRPKAVVYVEVTDGRGATDLELRLVDVDELRAPVFSLDAAVDFADNPNQILECVFEQPDVTFPESGEYRLQLFASGQLVRERRIHVLPYGKYPDSEGEEHE